jgi:hypothetical protein
MPAAGVSVDTLSIYNAGFTSYFSGNFERSVKDLLIAESYGFYQDGELYNVLYNSYRSLCGEDKEKLAGAKEFLLRGLKQFPGNSNIITCLTDLYLALGENPEEIVPLVKACFAFIRDFRGEVPGASAKDCGNYLDMNLPMANYWGAKYAALLENIDRAHLVYPE